MTDLTASPAIAYAALRLAAAYVNRQDTVAKAQRDRASGRVGHADRGTVAAIVKAEEMLVEAEAAYRAAVADG